MPRNFRRCGHIEDFVQIPFHRLFQIVPVEFRLKYISSSVVLIYVFPYLALKISEYPILSLPIALVFQQYQHKLIPPRVTPSFQVLKRITTNIVFFFFRSYFYVELLVSIFFSIKYTNTTLLQTTYPSIYIPALLHIVKLRQQVINLEVLSLFSK